MRHQKRGESIKKRHFSSIVTQRWEGARAQVLFMYYYYYYFYYGRCIQRPRRSKTQRLRGLGRFWPFVVQTVGIVVFPVLYVSTSFFFKNISFFQIRRLACGTFFSIHRYIYNYLKYKIIRFWDCLVIFPHTFKG